MSSITYRISQLHKEHQEWREGQEAERARADVLNRKRIDDLTAQLEYDVYNKLREEVHASCGITGTIKLFIGYGPLELVLKSERRLVVEKFEQHTGMDLKVDENNTAYVYVNLSEKLKVCTVMAGGKVVTLDYFQLNTENEARRAIWAQILPEFARAVIDGCCKCLETMPNKYLGIPEKMLVLKYNGSSLLGRNGITLFAGEFSIGSLTARYDKLSETQVKELAEKMNVMISHGEVEIDGSDHAMWVRILRRPEKVLDQPYFDYEDFYKKYDEVTPELRCTLNLIACNVEFPAMEEQLSSLSLQRKLVYWFSKNRELDFKLLRERLSTPVHKQHLIDVVNGHVRGVKVIDAQFLNREESWGSPRGCAHGTTSLDERIEFTVELDETTTSSAEVAKQLQLENVIWRIKHCRAQYFANVLVEAVLDDIYAYGRTRELFAENGKYWQTMCDAERLIVTLNGYETRLLRAAFDCEPEELKVDLREVKDEAFINRVAAAVQRRTGGMMSISLDATHGLSYKLVFGGNS